MVVDESFKHLISSWSEEDKLNAIEYLESTLKTPRPVLYTHEQVKERVDQERIERSQKN